MTLLKKYVTNIYKYLFTNKERTETNLNRGATDGGLKHLPMKDGNTTQNA